MLKKDKPQSMRVREWLTKTLSRRDHIPETTITAVIRHQYDAGQQALKENNSVEIAGFGNFFYNVNKAEKHLQAFTKKKKECEELCKKPSITSKKRLSYEQTIEDMTAAIEDLNKKLK